MDGNMMLVGAQSRTTALAGAIAGVIRERGTVTLQAVGAAAVNQMLKGVAIARSYLACDGLDLMAVPSFVSVEIAGAEKTGVRLYVESRSLEFVPAALRVAPRARAVDEAPIIRGRVFYEVVDA